MKKFFIFVMIGLFSFAFVACDRTNVTTTQEPAQTTTENETTTQTPTTQPVTTEPVVVEEKIDAPTNVRLDEKVLLWDAVTDAVGYVIYIDGSIAGQVTGTSYDFSANEALSITFQIVTKAPDGMLDSDMSASVAYQFDTAGEVAQVQALLDAFTYTQGLPDGFAEELVAKGMYADDVQEMITAIPVFMAAMETVEDPDAGLTAINALLAHVDNVEALVSAGVKVVLPVYLQAEIDMLDPEDVETKTNLQILLTEIETNPDAMVLAMVNTMEYVMSVEQMITSDLINSILALATGPTMPTGAEVEAILTEVAHILRTTMPTEEEVLSVILLVEAMQDAYSLPQITVVTDLNDKMVDSILFTSMLMVEFMDEITAADYDAIMAEVMLKDDYSEAEIVIVVAKLLDRFMENQDALITQLEAVYSDADIEALIDVAIDEALLQMSEDLPEGLETFIDNIDFATILALRVTLGDGFDAVLDEFVAMDGEILRQLVAMDGFYMITDESGTVYSNEVLDVVYANETEFDLAHTEIELTVLQLGVDLANAFVQTVDINEVNTYTEFVLDDIVGNFINNLDFEGMVTRNQDYDINTYNCNQTEVTTNDFVNPGMLGPDEYFSTRWGFAFKLYDMYGNEFFEITYVDPASPLLDMRLKSDGVTVYSLQVGDLISWMDLYDSTMGYTYLYSDGDYTEIVNQLDSYTEVYEFGIVTLLEVPEPMIEVAEANVYLGLIDTTIMALNPDGFAFAQNLLQYLSDNDVIVDLYPVLVAAEAGNDYAINVYVLQNYGAFMDTNNRALLDGILDTVYLTAKSAVLDDIVPFTDAEIDQIDVAIDTFFNALDVAGTTVSGFDYTNLNSVQTDAYDTAMQTVMASLETVMMLLNVNPS